MECESVWLLSLNMNKKNDCHFKSNVIIYSTNVKLHQISSWNYNENLTGSSTAIVNGCQIKSVCYWSQNDFPSLKLYINQIIALCSNLFIQNGEEKISIWLNLQILMNNDIIMSGKITYHKIALKKQQFMKNLHTHTLHDDQIEHMWWWCDEWNMQEMFVVNRLLFVNKIGYSFPCVRLTFVVINLCNIVITCVLQRNNIV